MSEQEKTIAAIGEADITVQDWDYKIIESIPDLYARGYLRARMGSLSESLAGEDYRQELLNICTYDIWNTRAESAQEESQYIIGRLSEIVRKEVNGLIYTVQRPVIDGGNFEVCQGCGNDNEDSEDPIIHAPDCLFITGNEALSLSEKAPVISDETSELQRLREVETEYKAFIASWYDGLKTGENDAIKELKASLGKEGA